MTADRYMDSDETHRFTGYSKQYLAQLRMVGEGPPYVKLGDGRQARVRYRLSEVVAWMEAHRRTSTSVRLQRTAPTTLGLSARSSRSM